MVVADTADADLVELALDTPLSGWPEVLHATGPVMADEAAARVVLLLWNTACYVARIVPAMPLGACRMHT